MTFEQTLARWVASQRWYPGRGQPTGELTVLADTMLVTGEPSLRHLIVGLPAGREQAIYQILVGLRADLPDSLQPALIGPAGGGLTAYDALHDPRLCSLLLDAVAAEKSVGPVRFAREPGAAIGSWRSNRVIRSEQSNTSVVFGEAAILKVFRRIFPGINPDLEVPAELALLGSRQVARPYGWIETKLDGEVAQLGVLSEYLADAVNGRILVLAHLRNLYGPQGNYRQSYLASPTSDAPDVGVFKPDPHGDFADEALELGRATGQLHKDLGRAFGSAPMPDEDLAALSADMITKLDDAVAEAPELAPHAPKLRAAFADLTATRRPVMLQRIHGDYHLAQTLHAHEGWVALDFEGEPSVPLALRRVPAPALRDVAHMLRSFDYEARLGLLGHPEAARLRGIGEAWAERCQAAFCAGYTESCGVDPTAHAPLLRALMLEKAVFEVVYNVHHRPAWLAIPLDAIAAA